jgi:hypothetical protein
MIEPFASHINNFSIRTCLKNMNKVKRTIQCLYFIRVTKLVKDTTGAGNDYNDNHYECSKMSNKRISKRACKNCNLYVPLNT